MGFLAAERKGAVLKYGDRVPQSKKSAMRQNHQQVAGYAGQQADGVRGSGLVCAGVLA